MNQIDMLVENFKDVDGLYVVGGAVRDYLMGIRRILPILTWR